MILPVSFPKRLSVPNLQAWSGADDRVSVVMGVYNGETLAATLDGILAQTHRGFACMVVDDGSTAGIIIFNLGPL